MILDETKFDRLLHAMATVPVPVKRPVKKKSKANQASSADASEGSADTRTPKGKSGATWEKR
jgi:hypothetical protein